MNLRKGLLLIGLATFLAAWIFFFQRHKENPTTPVTSIENSVLPAPSPQKEKSRESIEQQMNRLLDRSESSERTIPVPPTQQIPAPSLNPTLAATEKMPDRSLPPPPVVLGVVLTDQTPGYKAAQGSDRLILLQTGDLLEIQSTPTGARVAVRPRVDVFPAATTQLTEAAGERYPDQIVWVSTDHVQILPIDQAVDFTQSTNAMTLGNNDPNFSTFDFYLRAMKNPDPAVHRIIGARLIALVSLHEDYNSNWNELYRDPDPKVRSFALATLRKRGVQHSRTMVDDMISRVAELTKNRATGETEQEVLLLLDILKDSNHPRVVQAFASFREAWTGKQDDKLLNGLQLR